MTTQEIGGIGIVALVLLTLLRVPLGAAMGLVGLVGYAAIDGWERAFIVFGETPYSLTQYAFSVLPLFILMGAVATRSGMSQELFVAANALFAGRRGGTPDGDHRRLRGVLGDQRLVARHGGDLHPDRGPGDAALRLRRAPGDGLGRGRRHARHPDPALGDHGDLRARGGGVRPRPVRRRHDPGGFCSRCSSWR